MQRNYTGRTHRISACQRSLLRTDFYQGVVLDYLRADRAVLINSECCIQLMKVLIRTRAALISIAMPWLLISGMTKCFFAKSLTRRRWLR
jgi:hypothetical protein